MVDFYSNLDGVSNSSYNAFSSPFANMGTGSSNQDCLFPNTGINFIPMFDNIFMSSMFSFRAPFGRNNYSDKGFNTNTNLAQLKDVYNPQLSGKLASIANRNALQTGTIGKCSHVVSDTLMDAKLANGNIRVASAYQAASKLSENKNFKQVNIPREDLKKLPAGCVVVWDRSAGHEHGHIAVTLGNGKEASDHTQNLSSRNAEYSVFVPTGGNNINNVV